MNKIDTLKISNYDKFKCIADKCKFTCCEGWDISVDNDTYNKWENDKSNNILNNVKIKRYEGKDEYFINKETNKACPLLDNQGLCNIVKDHGENYLSLTCQSFPRIENVFEDRRELSLSCACPEVLELIGRETGKTNITSESNTSLESNVLEIRIREAVISILQQENFLLEDKLIISFQMLLTILENENLRKDALLEELEKYKNRDYVKELIHMYKGMKININDSIEEVNNLFLDIVENYKEVHLFHILLKDVVNFAENTKIKKLSSKWNDYKIIFDQYNAFIENCIISKIFSNCISNDIEEMIISLQMIILEYLMLRYSLFLKYCVDKEINEEDIKNYILAFSRIIGNNIDAMMEFIRDGFGDDVLEIGYLCFIALA
ncbi:flagellin lysine-N-methylase [Clostridium beijerinckii]|uniref:flagellin lysine-N-methylase n=1 Tax=Clostridium beijerinckii TaxID=1520 RepID=UPI00047C261D|nr:flagellin lysine-N-methylase [Clostridium beijerinckii]